MSQSLEDAKRALLEEMATMEEGMKQDPVSWIQGRINAVDETLREMKKGLQEGHVCAMDHHIKQASKYPALATFVERCGQLRDAIQGVFDAAKGRPTVDAAVLQQRCDTLSQQRPASIAEHRYCIGVCGRIKVLLRDRPMDWEAECTTLEAVLTDLWSLTPEADRSWIQDASDLVTDIKKAFANTTAL